MGMLQAGVQGLLTGIAARQRDFEALSTDLGEVGRTLTKVEEKAPRISTGVRWDQRVLGWGRQEHAWLDVEILQSSRAVLMPLPSPDAFERGLFRQDAC
jgi:hypothetical protein